MVELSQSPKKDSYIIERYAIELLPKDAITDGNINNLEAVSETMQRAWKRMGTRIKNISLALPAAAVISKKNSFTRRHERRSPGSTGRIRSQSIHPFRAGRS